MTTCECGSTLFHGPWPLVVSPGLTVPVITCAVCGRLKRLEEQEATA